MAFSNILDYLYEIYRYKANDKIKIFELQRLESEIINNKYSGHKRKAISRIEYLINELNKGNE